MEKTDKSIAAACGLTELISAPGKAAEIQLNWLSDPVLIYFKSGSYSLMLDLEEHEIQEECFCYVNPGALWRLRAKDGTEGKLYLLRFSYDALRPLHGGAIDRDLLCPLSEGRLRCRELLALSDIGYLELLHSMNRMLRAFRGTREKTGDENCQHYTVTAVMDQLLVLGELLHIMGLCESFGWFREAGDGDRQVELMKDTLTYIRENYMKKIYIHDLASLGGLNEQYYIRFFKSVIGLPPLDYINCYRVQRAQELMDSTNRRIYEIAEDCGFHNIGNFIKIFRSFTGMTPREYRSGGLCIEQSPERHDKSCLLREKKQNKKKEEAKQDDLLAEGEFAENNRFEANPSERHDKSCLLREKKQNKKKEQAKQDEPVEGKKED